MNRHFLKQIVIYLTLFIIILSCFVACNKTEEKDPLDLDTSAEYDDNTLLVFMDKYHSDPQKEWRANYFKNKHIVHVYCLNPNLKSNTNEYRQILKIILDEHSKELVLEVAQDVYKVRGVISVSLNYIDVVDNY